MKYILAISLPLFLLDQITKLAILKRFPIDPPYDLVDRIINFGPLQRFAEQPPGGHIEVIPGFFWLTRVHNTGMAFGLLNGNPYSNYIFLTIGIIATIVIIKMWRQNTFPNLLTKIAASLLLSGIWGNLTDRIIPGRGYVVDFLDFKLPLLQFVDKRSQGHFPSFNVADSCITVAGCMLAFWVITEMRREAAEIKAKKAE